MPRFLVFSGGGMNGFCYIGALMALEESGAVDFAALEGCIGTSIGALIALAICLGLPPTRLRHLVVTEADWSRVRPSMNVHSVAERLGIDTRAALEYLVELVLADAGLSPRITLRGAFALTKRHFCACASDLTHSRLRYLDHLQAPEVSVRDAVVASMCVPILFEPITIDGALCVDGGLVENLPIHFFELADSLVFHFRPQAHPQIRNWGDYVAAVLRCGTYAKEEHNVATAGPEGVFLCIDVPDHLPTGMELHHANTRVAQLLMTQGYMQASPQTPDLCLTLGSTVQLACAVHSSTQEPL